MTDLIYILPQFITAFLFGWVAFQFSTKENENVVLQMLFFILMFGFLISGFAVQTEYTHVFSTIETPSDTDFSGLHDITAITYGAMVIASITVICLLFLFILKGFFLHASESATGKKPKWDRERHEYFKT